MRGRTGLKREGSDELEQQLQGVVLGRVVRALQIRKDTEVDKMLLAAFSFICLICFY